MQEKFETVREEFRNAVMDVQQLGFRYMNAPNLDEAFPHFDKFEQKVVEIGQFFITRFFYRNSCLAEMKL